MKKHLKKGDVGTSYLSFSEMNEGGYGYHILVDSGEYVGMEGPEEIDIADENLDTTKIEFHTEQEGIYFLIITGDNLKGKIGVTWEIV